MENLELVANSNQEFTSNDLNCQQPSDDESDGGAAAAQQRTRRIRWLQQQISSADTDTTTSRISTPRYSPLELLAATRYAGATAGAGSLTPSYGSAQNFATIDSLVTAAYAQQGNNSSALMTMRAIAAAAQQGSAPDQSSFLLARTLQVQQQLAADFKMNDAVASLLAYKEQQDLLMYQSICEQKQSDALASSLQSCKDRRGGMVLHGNSSRVLHHEVGSTTAVITPPSLPPTLPSADPLQGYGTFPMVLHRALAELQRSTNGTDIACFLPDGKSFHVKNQYLLVEKVLPLFFPNMRSFSSFQRQLNFYDFIRIGGAGIDRGAYCHERFVRDCPGLASGMKRTKIKGGGKKLMAVVRKAAVEKSNA